MKVLSNGQDAVNKAGIGIKPDTLKHALQRHPEIEEILMEHDIQITRKMFKKVHNGTRLIK